MTWPDTVIAVAKTVTSMSGISWRDTGSTGNFCIDFRPPEDQDDDLLSGLEWSSELEWTMWFESYLLRPIVFLFSLSEQAQESALVQIKT